MSADDSVIDLTNETQEDLLNETQDDIEIITQNLKRNSNDEPIYCVTSSQSGNNQQTINNNKKRRNNQSSNDIVDVTPRETARNYRTPTNRTPTNRTSTNRTLINRDNQLSLSNRTSVAVSLPDFVQSTDNLSSKIINSNNAQTSKEVEKEPVVLIAYECPVCLEKHKENLVSTTCGHLFCLPCLKESLKTNKQCPKCRKKLTAKSFHPIYI